MEEKCNQTSDEVALIKHFGTIEKVILLHCACILMTNMDQGTIAVLTVFFEVFLSNKILPRAVSTNFSAYFIIYLFLIYL